MINDFLSDLRSIMIKHDIKSIEWQCADCSDLHGIYRSRLVICTEQAEHDTDYDYISPYTIKCELEG